MLLTDNELVYINASGIQRARLGEIAKVSRENGELVISSNDRPLIRGAIKADKETLSNFFSQVRQVAAWSRERRTVILESPSAVPMDSSFVGRTPDAPVSRPDVVDPVAQTPLEPVSKPVVMVSQSLGGDMPSPMYNSSPPPSNQPFGRGQVSPSRAEENQIPQDRPRVVATIAPRFSEMRSEPARLEYAGFWVRFFANFIDLILLFVAGGIFNAVFSGSGAGSIDSVLGLGTIASFLFSWLYYAFLESGERQGTLGKMALGLVVTNQNQERLTFVQATVRYLARAIPGYVIAVGSMLSLGAAALGSLLSGGEANAELALYWLGPILALVLLLGTYVMAAFTPKKQALHDMIAQTLVCKK